MLNVGVCPHDTKTKTKQKMDFLDNHTCTLDWCGRRVFFGKENLF